MNYQPRPAPDADNLRAALQRVLIAVTLQQTDAAKRADFVAILKKDSWL